MVGGPGPVASSKLALEAHGFNPRQVHHPDLVDKVWKHIYDIFANLELKKAIRLSF